MFALRSDVNRNGGVGVHIIVSNEMSPPDGPDAGVVTQHDTPGRPPATSDPNDGDAPSVSLGLVGIVAITVALVLTWLLRCDIGVLDRLLEFAAWSTRSAETITNGGAA